MVMTTDLVGKTLGQYEIVSEIAKGGMSTVYRARQKSVGRDVAIKVLPSVLLHDQKFLQRFSREVEVIAGLQHPHILPIYDYGEQDNMPYIVMAYLSGGTLADYISKRGPLPVDEVVRFVSQISSAMQFAHNKGIIHRDFKPSNVLLDEQGNTYLADFGVAKLTEGSADITGNAILGTPHYMSPEQASGESATTAVDVYAFGATVFQMLTGHVPYEAATPVGVILAHATQPIPLIAPIRNDLPMSTQDVIDKALAKSVHERYDTPTHLTKDLVAVLEGTPHTPHEPAPSTNALLMTNMLGSVIFVDQGCLQLLKRPMHEARTIVGKPFSSILGIEQSVAQQLLTDVSKTGRVEGIDMSIRDAQGGLLLLTVNAVATYDNQHTFVGMDVTLMPNIALAEMRQRTQFNVGQQHFDTQEESFLQVYFTKQIVGLQELLMNLGGRKLRDHFIAVLNDTAQRNVWPVNFEEGKVTVELNNKDADTYRALFAKAVSYAKSVIGEGVVTKQLDAIESKMEPRIRNFAKEMAMR
jgi:serine/threonine protein kinase